MIKLIPLLKKGSGVSPEKPFSSFEPLLPKQRAIAKNILLNDFHQTNRNDDFDYVAYENARLGVKAYPKAKNDAEVIDGSLVLNDRAQ